VYELKYLLFPQQRYQPGQPAEGYSVGDEDIKQAKEKWQAYAVALAQVLTSNPDIMAVISDYRGMLGDGDLMTRRSYEELRALASGGDSDRPRSTFSVKLKDEATAEQRARLKAALDVVDPEAVSFEWQLGEPDWGRLTESRR
jgi:hypothetical protein